MTLARFTNNPPRVAIADQSGNPTPEFYRWMASVTRMTGSAEGPFETARFLTLSADADLGSERVFSPVAGDLVGTDGGNNNPYTLGLASTAVVAGAYGGAGSLVSITVDGKGRLTGAATVAGADLTKTNDTNVTLTLGGTPTGSLLKSVSLTLGWTGTLAVARGGTGGGAASGTLLDNITGFASTGQIVRTGAGAYAFRTATGTANRLTVTNGDGVAGNPTFDISASYVGQSSITTLGTITTGVWNGSTIPVANGGTGVTTSTGSGANVQATQPQFTNTIGVGTAAVNSGSGVSFPATQSASTDPNTLDDYEEGTWTPTVTAGSGSITTYTASGYYTKIGRQVLFTAVVSVTNNGTGASVMIITLPFTATTGPKWVAAGRENVTTGNMLQGLISSAATTVNVTTYANAYPAGTGSEVIISGSYFV